MATLTLVRGTFQLEHSGISAAALGTNDYTLIDYTEGVVIKVEFIRGTGDIASIVAHVRWTLEDGSIVIASGTSFNTETASNDGIEDGVTGVTANTFHGTAIFLEAPVATTSCRVDVDSLASAVGTVDVYVAGY